jgi:hypothetical protein
MCYHLYSFNINRIGDIIISVLASGAVDPWLISDRI